MKILDQMLRPFVLVLTTLFTRITVAQEKGKDDEVLVLDGRQRIIDDSEYEKILEGSV